MPIEVPKEQKVYTTSYDNFKGVDLTNDPSNCWHRRSPDAVNMLPDSSGVPHKRYGWKVIISADTLATKYATDTSNAKPDEVTINKMYYFTLNGLDHVFIFSNIGVFVYRKKYEYNSDEGKVIITEEIVTETQEGLSYDNDVIDSYNRAYFFEGDGEAAFYIYGNFRLFRYRHTDNGFVFEEIEAYVPTVNISLDAKHESGTGYEAVNLLSKYMAEDFQSNVWLTVDTTHITTSRTGLSVTIPDEEVFLAMISTGGDYQFTYTANGWTLGGDEVILSNYGMFVTGTPAVNDWVKIPVSEDKKIKIPRAFDSATGISVKASTTNQFDTTISVITSGTPSSNQCKYVSSGGATYLEFANTFRPLVEGEDSIKVTFPREAVSIETKTTSAAEIQVEAR